VNKLRELYRYFGKNRIYLPPPLCDVVDKLLEDVRTHVVQGGPRCYRDGRQTTCEST